MVVTVANLFFMAFPIRRKVGQSLADNNNRGRVRKRLAILITAAAWSRWLVYESCATKMINLFTYFARHSNAPVPWRIGRPMTMLALGLMAGSFSPCTAASTIKLAVVSKLI